MENSLPIPPIPAEVSQLEQEAELGKLKQVFPTDIHGVRVSLRMENFLLFICIVVFFASVAFLLLSYWPTYMWFFTVLWLFTVIWLVGNLRKMWIWRQGGECFAFLYEHGLINALLLRGQWYLEAVSWKQVIAVWQTWGKGCLVSYEEAPGRETLIHIQKALREYDLLAKHIQTQVTRVRLPKYIEDFDRGEECSFVRLLGWEENRTIVEQGILITRQGLKYKQWSVPWSDVVSIEVKGKKVIIMLRKGSSPPRISLSVYEITNVEAFVGLVSHILEQRNGRA